MFKIGLIILSVAGTPLSPPMVSKDSFDSLERCEQVRGSESFKKSLEDLSAHLQADEDFRKMLVSEHLDSFTINTECFKTKEQSI